jgi:uncharacterized membrane protein YtjA (UPF0391 family)
MKKTIFSTKAAQVSRVTFYVGVVAMVVAVLLPLISFVLPLRYLSIIPPMLGILLLAGLGFVGLAATLRIVSIFLLPTSSERKTP